MLSSNSSDKASQQTTNTLQPTYVRLLASCAVLGALPDGAANTLIDSKQQKEQEQHVHDLLSHASHTQHHMLGLTGTAQLSTTADAVLEVVQGCQKSMTPSGSRALLPPLPLLTPTQPVLCHSAASSSAGSIREC